MILIRRFRTTLEKKHKVSFINKNTSYDILEGDSIVTGSNNQGGKLPFSCMPVSYTHLTLPTTPYV